jgi:hypothetical protein
MSTTKRTAYWALATVALTIVDVCLWQLNNRFASLFAFMPLGFIVVGMWLGLARWTVWPFVRHTLIFVLGEIVESLKKQEKEDE